jgi:pilus assembly protein TadC
MSDLQTLTLGVAGLAGAGTWLLLLTLGQTLVGLVGRVRLYRRTRAEQQLARYRAVMPATMALPDHVLYGYPDLSWQALGLGLAVVGILALLPVLGFPGALVAVVLERAPHLVRGQLVREGRARLRLRIRDFVDDLREAVAIHGSLGKALDALVATQGERADAVALALARRARSRSAQLSADQVLDGMAADLKSPDMREVAAQVRLALAGGMDLAEALSAVAETLSEVIAAEVNVRLQAAPNTYVLPMVLFMFGPLLILMLYPVALRVVALITGGA